jgi:hypothetical protein
MSLDLKTFRLEVLEDLEKANERLEEAKKDDTNRIAQAKRQGVCLGLESVINTLDIRIGEKQVSQHINELLED